MRVIPDWPLWRPGPDRRLSGVLRHRLRGQPQNLFIAGALASFDESSLDPPDQGMKPENRFDNHVNRRNQNIAPPYMAQLMGRRPLSIAPA